MSVVHVVPMNDVVAHDVPGGLDGHDEPSGWLAIEAAGAPSEPACSCGPAIEHVPNPDGPDGWLITHASLDGREKTE